MTIPLCDGRSLIIAEVAQSHDGSLGQAHAFIDAVARAGADAIKFQTHIAAAESTPGEPFRIAFSRQDASRYDYWRRMEFTPEQWAGLKAHAEEKGLVFLSSPFSPEAADLLERLGVAAWKIGSGEVASLSLLERVAATGKHLYVSTGMSGYDETAALVDRLRRIAGGGFTLMQCTTAYPTPLTDVGLNVLTEYRRRFACPVGLSDHSGAPWPSLAAAALGASALEVHVAFSREMFGPDVSSSLTIDELRTMTAGVRAIETMLAHPVDKDVKAQELADLRRIFGKSAVALRDLPQDAEIGPEDVAFRKPGGGIDEAAFRALVAPPARLRLTRAVAAGERLTMADVASL